MATDESPVTAAQASGRETLLPCPFCQSENIEVSKSPDHSYHHYVSCRGCCHVSVWGPNRPTAISNWQERIAPDEPEPVGQGGEAVLVDAHRQAAELELALDMRGLKELRDRARNVAFLLNVAMGRESNAAPIASHPPAGGMGEATEAEVATAFKAYRDAGCDDNAGPREWVAAAVNAVLAKRREAIAAPAAGEATVEADGPTKPDRCSFCGKNDIVECVSPPSGGHRPWCCRSCGNLLASRIKPPSWEWLRSRLPDEQGVNVGAGVPAAEVEKLLARCGAWIDWTRNRLEKLGDRRRAEIGEKLINDVATFYREHRLGDAAHAAAQRAAAGLSDPEFLPVLADRDAGAEADRVGTEPHGERRDELPSPTDAPVDARLAASDAVVMALRKALIDSVRALGGACTDDVSNEFLCQVPGEIEAALAGARAGRAL